jgi:hypothetical protein
LRMRDLLNGMLAGDDLLETIVSEVEKLPRRDND